MGTENHIFPTIKIGNIKAEYCYRDSEEKRGEKVFAYTDEYIGVFISAPKKEIINTAKSIIGAAYGVKAVLLVDEHSKTLQDYNSVKNNSDEFEKMFIEA